jgi:hypothetical protein
MAAITLQFEVGPETRALIERLAGKVIVEAAQDAEGSRSLCAKR